jgi:hypothetical protein
MFLHTATYLAIVRHILIWFYTIDHWVFVSPYIGIWFLGLNDINCQYNIPLHKKCRTLHPDKIPLKHILSQMFVYTIQKMCTTENVCTTEKAYYCMLLLLQQYWLVLVQMCNSEFLHFKTFHFLMELRMTITWSMCWTYNLLFLRNSLKMAPSCQNI